ncbi:hypothetical protein LAV73_16830 [Lysinibacillus xylanilyticus]|uniref:hypothetical protein n=1 Tax=Lysinibacillus xylanilyticus TaxID=582475 RepID=UPI002B248C63|nr:hypothetical protein [Lysinibacillus xylanilyticus]MEB2281647.1 hypothetical protein [Lysinibacillus xylanilyticus]
MGKIVFFLFLILTFHMNNAYSITTDLEKIYLENGEYTEVNKAIQEAKAFFKKDIPLPTRLPPISFTHVFASFNQKSSQLTIYYLDENNGKKHYTLVIIPNKNDMSYPNDAKKVHLGNGQEMVYFKSNDFIICRTMVNDFEYTIIVNKVRNNTITLDGIVKIINSII